MKLVVPVFSNKTTGPKQPASEDAHGKWRKYGMEWNSQTSLKRHASETSSVHATKACRMAEKADDLSSLITELQENMSLEMKKINTFYRVKIPVVVLFFVTGILKHLTKDMLLKHWFTLQKLVEWQSVWVSSFFLCNTTSFCYKYKLALHN